MLEQEMIDALNAQLNAEMHSGYLYLAMAAYFEDSDLSGFANWMNVQAQEELTHGMKFYDYIIQRGERVTLTAIATPQKEWKDAVDVFENVLAHEEKVTGLINDLVDLAIKEKDHGTNNFLQWFVEEQVEEEETAGDILSKAKLACKSPTGLYLLDQELSQRVFTPPTTE